MVDTTDLKDWSIKFVREYERNMDKPFFFFDMFVQERGGGFEIVISVLLGVVSANWGTS